ncbi:hypothetical protein HanIR_Chr08g0376611 [Helianthus annuus]|nr:hypothetical protein HanIR_Chr08g0376611 [Helianthus annuus]
MVLFDFEFRFYNLGMSSSISQIFYFDEVVYVLLHILIMEWSFMVTNVVPGLRAI